MEILIGKVTRYFNQIGVAVLELSSELQVGDRVLIIGINTDLSQVVTSMEIDHQAVQSANAGMEVALKVAGPVRKRDQVYKIVGEL